MRGVDKQAEWLEDLIEQLTPQGTDQASAVVIREAIIAAFDVTHECGSPEETAAAVKETYMQAIGFAACAIGVY